MKRKMIAMLLCVTALFAFTGCGKGKTQDTQATEAASKTGLESAAIEIDLDKQVTKLSDYKGIEVSVTGDYEVTDKKVEDSVMAVLPYYGITGVEIKDRDTVKKGDYVKIDYTGYVDGEAFDGGHAEDVMFDVSNNYDVTNQSGYIDGFGDGLIGAKVGEEASSDVTFPDDYQSTELAGKPATFKFNVKGIYEPVTLDNLTDDMVKEAFTEENLATKDDLIEYVRNVMQQQNDSYRSQDINNEVKEYIRKNSTVEIPEDYLQARLSEYEDVFVQENCGDQSLKGYAEQNATTVDEMRETWKSALEEQITNEFLFQKIAAQENIQIDEDGYTAYVDNIVSSRNKETTADELYQYYGNGSKEDGEQKIRTMYLVNKAITFVADNAKVTEKKAEDK